MDWGVFAGNIRINQIFVEDYNSLAILNMAQFIDTQKYSAISLNMLFFPTLPNFSRMDWQNV